MKVIIAGPRDYHDWGVVVTAIQDSGFTITEIVSGMATGVDFIGEMYGHFKNIPVTQFKADWKGLGRSAGPIRNKQMAEYADALIAVWDGKSRGTNNMILTANKLGLLVYVHLFERKEIDHAESI